MRANGAGKAKRVRLTIGLAAVVAVLLFVISGIPQPSPQLGQRSEDSGLRAFVTPSTNLYVNYSESGSASTWSLEYVTLNNTSTLHKLPYAITSGLSATNCRWVTIVNTTTKQGTFTSELYNNVTSANASGTVSLGPSPATPSFKICGGGAVWINYLLWTYGIYDFTFPGLGVNATTKFTFSAWKGTTAVPSALSIKGDSAYGISLKSPANLTFTVSFPLTANGSTSCTDFNQICSYTRYTFSSASTTGGSTVNQTGSITFGKGYVALASATWSNWTVGYTNSTISNNTSTGAFFLSLASFWSTWFVQYAAEWIIVVVLALVVAIALATHRRRGGLT